MPLPHVKVIATIEDTFSTGARTVSGAALQLSTTSRELSKGVTIKAVNANTDSVFVGSSSAVTVLGTDDDTDGFEVGAGESITVPIDNVNKVYIISDGVSQNVTWIAL